MKYNMSVMYIHPKGNNGTIDEISIPIGMVSISNKIQEIVEQYIAINMAIEESINDKYNILEELKKYKPQVVLIDLHWYTYSYSAIELCKLVKKYDSNCKVVLGGITASIYCEEILNTFDCVDFVIKGDGEVPVEKLLKKIYFMEEEYDDVPNLYYRKKNKCQKSIDIWRNNTFENLDYIDYDFLKNKEEFFEKQAIHKGKQINNKLIWIPIAKGCQYNCSYCGGNCKMFQDIFEYNQIMFNTPINIYKCMRKAKDKYGINAFGFTHSFELLNKKDINTLFELIQKLNYKPAIVNYFFQLPDKGDLKQYLNVIDTKRSIVSIPVINGNEDIRNKNGKLFNNEKIFEVLSMLFETNINVNIYLIANLLYDDEKGFEDTCEFIKKIYRQYPKCNFDISYGLEIIQPYSQKSRKEKETVLNEFKDYYYRYSNEYKSIFEKNTNQSYIIGNKIDISKLYNRIKRVKEIISKKEIE